MGRSGFKLVPKMVTPNIMTIHAVTASESMQIAEIHLPNDGQMNDNLEAAEGICAVLKKRIRKSV